MMMMNPTIQKVQWEIFSCTPDKENPLLVSSGDREIPTRGSIVPVGNEASPSFPLVRLTRGLGLSGFTVKQ